MSFDNSKVANEYTCNDYRAEMILLSLQKQLQQADLSSEKRKELQDELIRLEKEFGF